jgi:hypothetical protein
MQRALSSIPGFWTDQGVETTLTCHVNGGVELVAIICSPVRQAAQDNI